jgi:hypothetical protein
MVRAERPIFARRSKQNSFSMDVWGWKKVSTFAALK